MVQCAFNKTSVHGFQCTVCFHVDDVLCTSKKETMIMEFKNECLKRNVLVTEGRQLSYLSRFFDFSEEGRCRVSMHGNIDRLFEDEKVEGFVASTICGLHRFKTSDW